MTNPINKRGTSRTRRGLLKTVAAGGGLITSGAFLPSRWTTPVVDTVILPAHAQTSLIGCRAVFCPLDFGQQALISGGAEVRDGILTMLLQTGTVGDGFGSGPVAPDGTFSIVVQFENMSTAQVMGFVEEGCIRILGQLDPAGEEALPFSGSASGLSSIQDCFVDPN